jgi:hypothetical protein
MTPAMGCSPVTCQAKSSGEVPRIPDPNVSGRAIASLRGVRVPLAGAIADIRVDQGTDAVYAALLWNDAVAALKEWRRSAGATSGGGATSGRRRQLRPEVPPSAGANGHRPGAPPSCGINRLAVRLAA